MSPSLALKTAVFERGHHHALREPTQIAAFLGAARIGGFLLGHFSKCFGISLDLLEDFFGLGLSLVLTLTEVDQDVGGAPFFRSLEAALILFVEGLDVSSLGSTFLKRSGEKTTYSTLTASGRSNCFWLSVQYFLASSSEDLHLDHVFADAQVVHRRPSRFSVRRLKMPARGGIGNQRRTGDAFGEQIAADFTAESCARSIHRSCRKQPDSWCTSRRRTCRR